MAVAVYFLDKLALRAGHEKDDDEADTVGCCTLKVSAMSHTQPQSIPGLHIYYGTWLHSMCVYILAAAPAGAALGVRGCLIYACTWSSTQMLL